MTTEATTRLTQNDDLAKRYRHHEEAMEYPDTLFELALVRLLFGWQLYAWACTDAYGGHLRNDGVLGASWSKIGEGLLGLLNGQVDRLDRETLEAMIGDDLRPPAESILGFSRVATDNPTEKGWRVPACASCRAEAIAEGVLIDVTPTAKEAGFQMPVTLTQALWSDIQAIPDCLRGETDAQERLREVLFVGRCAMSQQFRAASTFRYRLKMPGKDTPLYEVKARYGHGTAGEPVVTLMQTGED